jgi:hypothetical protein
VAEPSARSDNPQRQTPLRGAAGTGIRGGDLFIMDNSGTDWKVNSYQSLLQAPVGVTPILECWMELN